jgi:hypothetical protein
MAMWFRSFFEKAFVKAVATSPAKAGNTISALANTDGGDL